MKIDLTSVFLVLVLMVVAFIAFAGENPYSYRSLTPEDYQAQYATKAARQAMEALQSAYIAGQISEATFCPCYEIVISSDIENSFLRVDRSNCFKDNE